MYSKILQMTKETKEQMKRKIKEQIEIEELGRKNSWRIVTKDSGGTVELYNISTKELVNELIKKVI